MKINLRYIFLCLFICLFLCFEFVKDIRIGNEFWVIKDFLLLLFFVICLIVKGKLWEKIKNDWW